MLVLGWGLHRGHAHGLRMVKVWWAKMDAVKLVTEGLPEGKERLKPELYFDSVLEGSRIVADQCTKDIVFE